MKEKEEQTMDNGLTISGKDMHTALTIAGSDCSGGAGIQADIKTMTMNGVYAMSCITALTAQNTTGVTGIMEVSPEFLRQQLDAVFTDIFPDAVKIGMVSSPNLIEVIAERLRFYQARNIVVDPVMVATSGAKLIADEAIEVLIEKLMPLAALVTPNIPEAEILSGMKITSEEEMEKAAKIISERISGNGSEKRVSVLVKGGHSICDANDVLYDGADGSITCYKGEKIDNPNTHGTGCTLSSAIASMLAINVPLFDAVGEAKTYLTDAIRAGLDLGKGSGPLMHNYTLYEKA